MKYSVSIALLGLASLASAQTKGPSPVKDPNGGGYAPPPPGQSFLVAGGSDDCSAAATADAISGTGTFAVTTLGATNGAPDATGCVNTQLDVWFYWTSTITGLTILSTCGGTTADTVLSVWNDGAPAGSCPTTSLVCNDDFCGLQSTVSFSAIAGSSYFLQLGAFGAGATYSGTFTISAAPSGPPNDDCSAPIPITGSGSFAFDNSAATTGAEGQTEALCLFFAQTAIGRDAWWTWTATQSGTATLTTCGTTTPTGADTKVAIYSGAGCPASSAIACNDDAACTAGGLTSTVSWSAIAGQTYTIQLGQYPLGSASIAGTFAITESCTSCPVGIPYCFGDGSAGACPCANNGASGNGCANSLNPSGANLTATGSASIATDTLLLQGSGMSNGSALYFQGTVAAVSAFGDGLKCALGTIRRLGTVTNSAGASSYPSGAEPAVSVRGLCAAGDVRNYQCWYRNKAAFCTDATFNLTNGVQISWTP